MQVVDRCIRQSRAFDTRHYAFVPLAVYQEQVRWFNRVLKEYWRLQLLKGDGCSRSAVPPFVVVALYWVRSDDWASRANGEFIRAHLRERYPDVRVSKSEQTDYAVQIRNRVKKKYGLASKPAGYNGDFIALLDHYQRSVMDTEKIVCLPMVGDPKWHP